MPKPTKSKVKPKGAVAPSSNPAESHPPPSWPPFKPPLPIVDLAPALHEATPKIVLVPSFFPRSLCRDYVSFLRTLPMQTTPSRPKRGEAVRVNDRFQIHDPLFARRLWEQTGLKGAILDDNPDLLHLWGGEPVGSVQISECTAIPRANTLTAIVRTTWTLLLYLTSASEGCMGGETVFYPRDRRSPDEEIAVQLETGLLLLHKHGDDCLLHEGREVLDGEKWVLRTDLCIDR